MSEQPRVVAVGGGHGTAVTLRAARSYAGDLIAVVSVADDGGSSGRLRELLGVPALGDIRKCLVALAEPGSPLARAMEYRYSEGELAGHALGNLLLAGLIEAHGDLVEGIDEAAALLGAVGRVLPATTKEIALWAEGPDGGTVGQVAIARETGITTISIVPEDASAHPDAVQAILDADQVLIGPGSLYTSVLGAAVVPDIRDAISETDARRIYIANLHPQIPETAGYSLGDHLAALDRHGITVDDVLCDTSAGIEVERGLDRVVDADLTGSNGLVHDPGKLAAALRDLLA